MTKGLLYIAAYGASTPIGRDALSSAAAVRAAISGFTEHPHIVDTGGQPMRVAMAPWLDIDCTGADRFDALLVPAGVRKRREPTGQFDEHNHGEPRHLRHLSERPPVAP